MSFLIRLLIVAAACVFLPMAASADLKSVETESNAYRDRLVGAAAALDPELQAARLETADAAIADGRWQDAVAALRDAIGMGRQDSETWLKLANAAEKAGSIDDALGAAYQASLLSANDIRGQALLRVLNLLDRAGRASDAVAAFDEAFRYTWDSQSSDRAEALRATLTFDAVNSRLDLQGETPRACIDFRGPLQDAATVHYEDYVKISPSVQADFDARDNALCIGGLDFGTGYGITLLQGLPSADGAALPKTVDFHVEIANRDPSVGFRDKSYVLPRIGSTGIPVITVNVERVAVKLMRINDRNLVGEINYSQFLSGLEGYSAQQIVETSGEQVWKGSMAVENQLNKRVVTAFPISDVVKEPKPGLYILMAWPYKEGQKEEDDSNLQWQTQATQWLVVSDIGLTTFSGADGLTVSARSLDSGLPMNGVDLQLVARNNEILAEAKTDDKGLARFDPGLLRGEGGRSVTVLMASQGDGDFSFIDMTRGAFDLADRGVGGRFMPGATDLFFYFDRGVYRPGETVHLMALLRDQGARAIENQKISLRLLRPDGAEAARFPEQSGPMGGVHLDIPIAATARTGSWTVEAYVDPEGAPIASASYLVEDVVPATIETTVTPTATELQPGTPATAAVSAKFLYGAPAANLPVRADLTIAVDSDPFPALTGYKFGLVDETVEPVRLTFDNSITDAEGAAAFDLAIADEDLPDTPQPLSANLRVEVYEFGGRPVIKSVKLPIRSKPLAIGIKPLFADDEVPYESNADFELIAVDAEGKPVAAGDIAWRFIREDWDYQWYYANGAWDYNVVVRDQDLQGGDLSLKSDAPGKLSVKTEWGNYRLEVYDKTSGAATSVRFHAGWMAKPGTTETPDRLRVVADHELYQVGDTAQVALTAPFAGQALVTIATDHVIETSSVELPAAGATISVKVDASWGAGAYVLVNAFRPGAADQHGPGRAIGLAWLAIDAKPRQLQISMTVPEKVLPRQKVEIPVSVANLSGGQVYLTLAAVDEGVLQLTDFETPDPLEHYFGKRRLGLDLRDVYGQLIDGKEGRRGEIREGGDGESLARGAPSDIKIVALFSGPVALDANGKAVVSLDIPDYNGRLRLMAVAYDAGNVGSAEAGLVVRDPVVTLVSVPRFLAPGDKSAVSISLQNLDAPAGAYTIALTAADSIQVGDGASYTVNLASGATDQRRIPLLGRSIGAGALTLAITGPGGFSVERSFNLPVRSGEPRITQSLSRILKPGESLAPGSVALDTFLPETGSVTLSVSAHPNLDVQTVMRDLYHYPYGCLEQTTSVAFPLLYTNELAAIWDLKNEYAAEDPAQIGKAIARAFEHQRTDGMFSLWDGDGMPYRWLSAYTMDFLTEAKSRGFPVSELAYANGISGLQLIARDYNAEDAASLNTRAYALYVLAKAQAVSLSDLRYLNDVYLDRLPTPIAAAQLAAALAISGDLGRAEKAMSRAVSGAMRLGTEYPDLGSVEEFGSPLRDVAAVATLMIEAKLPNSDVGPLLERLASMQAGRAYLSTQEQAWILRAARATSHDETQMKLTLNDAQAIESAKPWFRQVDYTELGGGTTIRNNGSVPVYAKATASGIPKEPLPAISAGFSVQRQLFAMDGTVVDPMALKQNDIVVVLIQGASQDQDAHQVLVEDLLPAGIEIENERLTNNRRAGELGWLPQLTELNYSEFLDDRFVAAFDLRNAGPREFAVAYVARIVSPGDYKLPAVQVEDMYRPELRGRGTPERINIAAYGK